MAATIPTHAIGAALAPDRDTLATLDEGGPIRFWDIATGRPPGTIDTDPGPEPMFGSSPDGSTFGVLSSDQIVRLYDTDPRALILTLPASQPDPAREFCYARSLAFSDDGSLLAARGCDGVRVWTLDPEALLEIARANVTRPLTDDECRRSLHECPAA